jgi:threonine dehydrogenase-like Zn-dependent dehydrogenase
VKALTFHDSLKVVDDAPSPQRDGEALVRVICAGICNTDLEIARGYAGFKGVLGHEFVGRVVEALDSNLVGRRVVGEINAGCGSCDLCAKGDPRHCKKRTVLGIKGRSGAFAEFLSLPVCNLIEVPDSVSDEAAVFAEPLAAALGILEQVQISPKESVVLIGDGKLALLVVLALAQAGENLTVIGKHESKLDLARRFGARKTIDARAQQADLEPADVVIEASGSPSGLETALRIVKPGGTVVLKSTHHEPTTVDLSTVVVNELKIIGSRCGRMKPAIEMLKSDRVDPTVLISNRFELAEGVRAFAQASMPEAMKVILQIS